MLIISKPTVISRPSLLAAPLLEALCNLQFPVMISIRFVQMLIMRTIINYCIMSTKFIRRITMKVGIQLHASFGLKQITTCKTSYIHILPHLAIA